MDDVLRAKCLAGDGFLRREILRFGYDDNAIADKIQQKEWYRVRQGGYFLTDLWNQLDDIGQHLVRSRMVSRTCRVPHALSHTTAVAHHGAPLWDVDLGDVHLTRTDGRSGRSGSGVRQHRGVLLSEHVVEVQGLSVTSPVRAVLELSTVTHTERVLIVLDDMLHRGLFTHDELRRMADRMRFWPNSLAMDLAVRLCDPRAESPAESRFRYLCWCMGLPRPVSQYEVRDGSGRLVARVDFAWPQYHTFVEIDGFVKYSGDAGLRSEPPSAVVVREKQREDLVRRLTDWRCLRFVWADLDRRERTAAAVRAAFRSSPRGFVA